MKDNCVLCATNPSKWRGLCGKCYNRVRYRGELEEYALPPAPNSRIRPIGDRQPTIDGYVTIKTVDGIIGEHRHVMEQMLGRKLVEGETVHHINGVRDDNVPSNLELWFAQPYGQRVDDLLAYVARVHADAIKELLNGV